MAPGMSRARDGDTEVLAHLAETHDAVTLARKLDGMFAFAIWDRRRQRLVLGRDRLGKKPLYYWRSARAFVFASEIKGVLAHPDVACELDDRAIPMLSDIRLRADSGYLLRRHQEPPAGARADA